MVLVDCELLTTMLCAREKQMRSTYCLNNICSFKIYIGILFVIFKFNIIELILTITSNTTFPSILYGLNDTRKRTIREIQQKVLNRREARLYCSIWNTDRFFQLLGNLIFYSLI